MKGLLRELKRRKVARVAVVYAATAFVVLQAADLLASGLRLPEWVFPTITVLLVIGFPVAVVLDWVLEITPEGVRVTTSPAAAANEPQLSLLGRRTVVVTAFLITLGLGLGAGLFLAPDGLSESALGEARADPRSLAVLSFTDLSEARDQKWFAEGIAEEILTSLARLPELRVVGRGSSFLFDEGTLDDRVIADTLGVAHLVKGSVRRVDSRLRVSAQLVRSSMRSGDRPDQVLLWLLHELGERELQADLVRRIDALPAGPSILAWQTYRWGRHLTFDVRDAPNFSARLREAGVDPQSLPLLPRISAAGGAR